MTLLKYRRHGINIFLIPEYLGPKEFEEKIKKQAEKTIRSLKISVWQKINKNERLIKI